MTRETMDEIRVYNENGEVKVRHIRNENPDMTPHPNESRSFVKDGEVITEVSKFDK